MLFSVVELYLLRYMDTLVVIGGWGLPPEKSASNVPSNGYFVHNTGTLRVQMTYIWV